MPASIVDSSVSFSAGAIYTTVGDLYKWDRALLAGKILSPASRLFNLIFHPFLY
jgi:hypothetical protein